MTARTIGIVGGMSPQSTMTYYDHIVATHLAERGDHAYPRIVLASVSFQQYVDWQHAGAWAEIARGLEGEVAALGRAGADFALLATNTMHKVLPQMAPAVPMLSIYDVVAAEARTRGFRRVALTGTRFTMAEGFYPAALRLRGLEVELPSTEHQDEIHRIIYDELIAGRVLPSSVARFAEICLELASAGTDAVLLACTELELLTRGTQAAFPAQVPTLDTTALHATHAWRVAMGDAPLPG